MPSLQGNWYEGRSMATTSVTSGARIGRIAICGAKENSSGAVAMSGHVLLDQPLIEAAGKLKILPRLALVGGCAQQVRRMIRHHQRGFELAEVMHLAAQARERHLRPEQVLRRDPSHRQHDLRPQEGSE